MHLQAIEEPEAGEADLPGGEHGFTEEVTSGQGLKLMVE